MALKIKETATRLLLTGPRKELEQVAKQYEYRPDRYWMADSYQIYRRWLKAIAKARDEGNETLAQALEARPAGWDGWKRLLKLEYKGDYATGVILRGHLHDILEFARAYEIPIDGTERLKNPFEGITIDDIPDDLLAVELDPDQWEIQKRCIHAWISHGMGRNKVTVSGGKTAMFCAVAALVKTKFPKARFLYFTPTERLSKQVYEESQRFLPDWDISKFGGGGDRDDSGEDMVVATGAILNKRFKDLKKSGWITSFMGLLIDEAQYATSPSWSKVILASGAYFRFAASDTVKEDNDEVRLAITGLTGPIYERVEAIELINIDRIASPTIDVVSVPTWTGKFDHLGHEPLEDTPAWILADGEWLKGTFKGHVYDIDGEGNLKLNKRREPIKLPGLWDVEVDGRRFSVESRWCILERKYDQAIIRFNERNKLIAERAVDYAKREWSTLVVATRTLHVMILEALIKERYQPELVRVLYSAHGSDERDEAFAWLKSNPGAILISPLVKVGVSINEIRGGVIADFVSDWEYSNQLIGRFIRKKPDGTPNEAEITMFAENQHHSYYRIHNRLFKKLQKIEGYRWKETVVNA